MLIINEKEIQENYGMKEALADVEHILRAKAKERIANPHRTIIEFPQHSASVLYMPSSDLSEGYLCMKFSCLFKQSGNSARCF